MADKEQPIVSYQSSLWDASHNIIYSNRCLKNWQQLHLSKLLSNIDNSDNDA